jgi:hypothetical protein
MKQSPWEANSHSGSQDTPRLLWNPKLHYSVYNSPPVAYILRQIHSVHTFPPCFPKIHSNIILPFTPKSSEWSSPFRFSDQTCVCISHLSDACYVSFPPHHSWFDHPNMCGKSSRLHCPYWAFARAQISSSHIFRKWLFCLESWQNTYSVFIVIVVIQEAVTAIAKRK